jgi:hypothetical protein
MTLEEKCSEQFPVSTESHLASLVNRLLWGDWDKGEFGVLVRTTDVFDDPETLAKFYQKLKLQAKSVQEQVYLPGSFIHASMRARGGMYAFLRETSDFFTVLVGTKYKQNWAMKDLQRNGTVDCPNYYPSDAATVGRGVLEDPNATFCRPGQTGACCVNGTCLAQNDSACGECTIPGAMVGNHVADFVGQTNATIRSLSYLSCWYPNSRHGLENMVAASNTLWQQRLRWNDIEDDRRYPGYTECPLTTNIQDPEMLDCLVVPIFSQIGYADLNLCHDEDRVAMQRRLRRVYHTKYGTLPILFYREIKGMSKTECDRFWGGIDCEDGYRKDFFSQEFRFDDGSCIYRPVGCKAEYYFPPHNDSDHLAGCSAFTEKGARRIELLRVIENGTVSIKDPAVVTATKVRIIVEAEHHSQTNHELRIPIEFEPVTQHAQHKQQDTIGRPSLREQDTASSRCHRDFPIIESPTGRTTNRLLRGNWDMGDRGFLLYPSLDLPDHVGPAHTPLFSNNEHQEREALKALASYRRPVSFLHASFRAPLVVDHTIDTALAVLVGTKYQQNWSMKQVHENGRIECRSYYPAGGGKHLRDALDDLNATACRFKESAKCCVNGTSMVDSHSLCGACNQSGSTFGDHVTTFPDESKMKYDDTSSFSCWYPKSHRGMTEMVAASNSLWKERGRWFNGRDLNYRGRPECLATTESIMSRDMIDAIVIMLFNFTNPSSTICNHLGQNELQKHLQAAHDGGYGSLPVLLFRQYKGRMSESDCQQLWGGEDCVDGYQAVFISQEYTFQNGACLYRPPGCREVYYFPAEHTAGIAPRCSAFSESAAMRIEEMCRNESSNTNANLTGTSGRPREEHVTTEWLELPVLEYFTSSLLYFQRMLGLAVVLFLFMSFLCVKKRVLRTGGCARLERDRPSGRR